MALLDPYTGLWTEAEAAHLARRAGFGASPTEIATLVGLGMDAAVDSIVDYDPAVTEAEFLAAVDALPPGEGDKSVNGEFDTDRIKNPIITNSLEGWWIFRMANTSSPFQEQFTLFLHDHFVSEVAKTRTGIRNRVVDGNDGNPNEGKRQLCETGTLPPDPSRKRRIGLRLIREQNELLRSIGHGPFRWTLLAVTRDPAMLLYLDNWLNKKGKPQENYGRELMELFSMGVGNYSEDDVQEVARALTGETVNDQCAEDWPYSHEFDCATHDPDPKTIFGQTVDTADCDAERGAETERVIDLILERVSGATAISPAHGVLPATCLYMSWKLITWFVRETIPIDDPAVAELGAFFHDTEVDGDTYNVRETLRRLFKSQLFYDPAHRFKMYKHPVDFMLMALRTLGIKEPGYTFGARFRLDRMGMRLFSPPNVAGWNHGRNWINSGNLINRYNYADRLSRSGIAENYPRGGIMTDAQVDALLEGPYLEDMDDHDGMIRYFRDHLIQCDLDADEEAILKVFLSQVLGDPVSKFRRKVRGLLHIFMTMSKYQLK